MIYVKDIMTSKVKTSSPSTTVYQVARLMSKSKIGSVVITQNAKCVGIVTEGDVSRAIAKGLDPSKTTIKSIMSKPVITTTLGARLEEAAKKMADSKIKKLPVLEDGKLIGIVTQTDIVAYSFDLVNTLKELVRARYRPPDFEP